MDIYWELSDVPINLPARPFCQFRADGNPGGFGNPLYGLSRLKVPNKSVHVFEGEKCADAGNAAGLVAISTCGGAGAGHLAKMEPLSSFKVVVIHPDNDEPSRQRWVPALIEKLKRLPNPPRILICDLPGVPEKGDIVDWMQDRIPKWDGYDLPDAPDSLKKQLQQVIRENSTPSDDWLEKFHFPQVNEGVSEKWVRARRTAKPDRTNRRIRFFLVTRKATRLGHDWGRESDGPAPIIWGGCGDG